MMRDKLPLVSIIIPCYNYGEFIRETVDSALGSLYGNLEIIIVDDGSTDDLTLDVLKQWSGAGDSNIKVLYQENKGLSGARNAGILAAQGEYFLPLDADDLIHPTYISKAVWIMEKYSNLGFVYPLVQLFGEYEEVWITEPFNFDFLLHHNYVPAAAVVRRIVWQQVGGYDEQMRLGYEDWEFWIRASSGGWSGRRINEILFYYRKHGHSMLSDSRNKHVQIVRYIRAKHKKLYRLKWTLKISFLYLKKKIFNFVNKKLYSKIKQLKFLRNMYVKAKKLINNEENDQLQYFHRPEARIWELDKTKVSKFKIVFILPWLKVGGVEQVFYDLLSRLNKENYQLTVMTTLVDAHPWNDKFLACSDYLFHLPLFAQGDDEMVTFLLDYIMVNDIDCLHISNSQFGYRVARLIKQVHPKIKIIDTLHMEEPYEPWDYFRFSSQYSEYLDQRIVITNYLAERLVSTYSEREEKITVIENGVDFGDSNLKPTGRKAHIVFVGRFVEQKQPLLFVEIAKRVLEHDKSFRFIMIGDGPLKDKVAEKIEKHQLSQNIQSLGYQSNVKEILLNDAKMLIAPSLREGLPLIGIEAMITRTLIIAADVPGWNDIIDSGTNGCLIPQDDIAAYVRFILRLNDDKVKYEQLVAAAYDKALNHYSASIMADSYDKIYKNLN